MTFRIAGNKKKIYYIPQHYKIIIRKETIIAGKYKDSYYILQIYL